MGEERVGGERERRTEGNLKRSKVYNANECLEQNHIQNVHIVPNTPQNAICISQYPESIQTIYQDKSAEIMLWRCIEWDNLQWTSEWLAFHSHLHGVCVHFASTQYAFQQFQFPITRNVCRHRLVWNGKFSVASLEQVQDNERQREIERVDLYSCRGHKTRWLKHFHLSLDIFIQLKPSISSSRKRPPY